MNDLSLPTRWRLSDEQARAAVALQAQLNQRLGREGPAALDAVQHEIVVLGGRMAEAVAGAAPLAARLLAVPLYSALLSGVLWQADGDLNAASRVLAGVSTSPVNPDLRERCALSPTANVGALVALAVSGCFDLQCFGALLDDIGYDWHHLHADFVGAQSIVLLRANVEAGGASYRRVWFGRDERQHLREVLQTCNCDAPGFAHTVYLRLSERYERPLPGWQR